MHSPDWGGILSPGLKLEARLSFSLTRFLDPDVHPDEQPRHWSLALRVRIGFGL